MHDQADQLRQLVRRHLADRFTSPPLVAVAGVRTKLLSLELAKALVKIERQIVLIDANHQAQVGETPAIAFRRVLHDVQRQVELHPSTVDLIVLDAGESTTAAILDWQAIAQQVLIAAENHRDSLLAQYTAVKRAVANKSCQNAYSDGRLRLVLHAANVEAAAAAPVAQPVATQLIEHFAATCQQFLGVHVAEGYSLAGEKARLELATAVASECVVSTARLVKQPLAEEGTKNQEIPTNRFNSAALA